MPPSAIIVPPVAHRHCSRTLKVDAGAGNLLRGLDVLEALGYHCERGIFVHKLCMDICHYPFGLGISCIIQKHFPSYVPFPSLPDCATPLPLSSLQQSPCKGQLQLC